MIYLKNKQTNEIKTFEVGNYLQLSKNIRNQYVEATQKEINAYLLQEAKNSKIAEIKAAKDEALYLPIDYLDTQFISSEKASQNILGALVLNGDNNYWLDINGNVLVLSRAELEQLGILIKTQRGMVYNNESTKITAINNATTIEEVNNITW
jgi:hypothetical protein